MSEKVPVSVLVQTKNEEAAIGACLDRLEDFGEVVVVDSYSDDATVEIARARGARVVEFRWNRRYPKKKQWQLENVDTAYPWILFLDADEYPSPDLVEGIRALVADPGDAVAGQLTLSYHFAGKRLRHGHTVKKTVLLRPGKVRFPVIDDLDIPGMGELEGHYQPICDGDVVGVAGTLEHDDPDPVSTWFARHNGYSSWEAQLRLREGAGGVDAARSGQGKLFHKVPFKPLVFFTYSYVLRGGFLDGRAGFDYAIALAMYYWQIGVKAREGQRLAEEQEAVPA